MDDASHSDGSSGDGSSATLSEQIERAREDARQKREQAGLPPLAPESLERPRTKKGKPAGGKRWKKHGQFMSPTIESEAQTEISSSPDGLRF